MANLDQERRTRASAVQAPPPASRRALPALLLLLVVAAGCTAPIGIERLSPRGAYRQLASNALTANQASDASQIVLRRHNLTALFDENPAGAIAHLRQDVVDGTAASDEIFALAELSILYSQDSGSKPHALAAAVYAYAYLFPENQSERPHSIDQRYRWAADIYAAGLTDGLRDVDGKSIDLQAGRRELPFGSLDIAFDAGDLVWGNRVLTTFSPVAEYDVEGMRNRYRHRGLGVALAATTTRSSDRDDLMGDRIRVPATAVLRFEQPRQQIRNSDINGNLDIFSDAEQVEIGGRQVPLEIDRTAPLASTLVETAFWKEEIWTFLGDALGLRKTSRLVIMEPHRPGRIPVVFVHGTASSPGRWADMVNDLLDDDRIRSHYQFYFFTYDSGNPIAYSAYKLRKALSEAVEQFDPEQKDPCIRDMVVIGHSQGGLLTKMTAIDSGDALWSGVSKLPFDQLRMPAASRQLLQEGLFVKPLPEVKRVVFVATPHQGSYLASSDYLRRLMAKLISTPRELTQATADLVGATDPSMRIASMQRLPTSIDNMSPGQPFIKALATIPIAPGVKAHSIIPVDGVGPPDDLTDGVVAYSSAHIEGVESEYIVQPCTHSTQSNPETVAEVRRILLLHLQESPCPSAAASDRPE